MSNDQVIIYIFAIIGIALSVVRFMQWLVVPLRDLAKMTAWKTDDDLVELLAQAAAKALSFLLWLGKVLAPLALSNPKKTFSEPPKPTTDMEEVGDHE